MIERKTGVRRRCRVCKRVFDESELIKEGRRFRCPNCGSDLFNILNPRVTVKNESEELEKQERELFEDPLREIDSLGSIPTVNESYGLLREMKAIESYIKGEKKERERKTRDESLLL